MTVKVTRLGSWTSDVVTQGRVGVSKVRVGVSSCGSMGEAATLATVLVVTAAASAADFVVLFMTSGTGNVPNLSCRAMILWSCARSGGVSKPVTRLVSLNNGGWGFLFGLGAHERRPSCVRTGMPGPSVVCLLFVFRAGSSDPLEKGVRKGVIVVAQGSCGAGCAIGCNYGGSSPGRHLYLSLLGFIFGRVGVLSQTGEQRDSVTKVSKGPVY